jgi:gluconolactonase
MILTEPLTPFVTGLDSPEGPVFDPDGNLFFVNWLSSSIYRATPQGEVTEYFNTGGIPAGLAFHPDGTLYVADEGDDIHGLLRIGPDMTATILVNEFEGQPLNGANDLVIDRDGSVYFSDPWRSSLENPVGGFYRFHDDGRLEQLDFGLAFPNGVAMTPDRSAIILAETQRNRLLRYALNDDGSVGPRTHWADTYLPSGPDGMAFDADGRLFVAHFGGGAVDIYDRQGHLIGKIEIPGANVTNVAFGGEDMRTIVVTEVETGTIYRGKVEVPGALLPALSG